LPCEERDRLTRIYLSAVALYDEQAKTVSDLKSEAWRDASKRLREACQDALANLNAHRKEHGC
jgi:hypothetical protein